MRRAMRGVTMLGIILSGESASPVRLLKIGLIAVARPAEGGRPIPHAPSASIAMRNTELLLLACGGGAVDAVSYLELGRVFTANMTGNTLLLGLALVQAESPAAIRSAVALAGFLVGGALGACIVERR
jgi:Protein of unknown function (DUF1275)